MVDHVLDHAGLGDVVLTPVSDQVEVLPDLPCVQHFVDVRGPAVRADRQRAELAFEIDQSVRDAVEQSPNGPHEFEFALVDFRHQSIDVPVRVQLAGPLSHGAAKLANEREDHVRVRHRQANAFETLLDRWNGDRFGPKQRAVEAENDQAIGPAYSSAP